MTGWRCCAGVVAAGVLSAPGPMGWPTRHVPSSLRIRAGLGVTAGLICRGEDVYAPVSASPVRHPTRTKKTLLRFGSSWISLRRRLLLREKMYPPAAVEHGVRAGQKARVLGCDV